MSIIEDLKIQFKTGGVVTQLIFWNVVSFVIPVAIFGVLSLFSIKMDYLSFVSLSSYPQDLIWKPWSILSYAFFHADVFHILFNLLMLHFAGRLFLTFFNPKQFLSLYFVSVLFSGLFYLLCYFVLPSLQNTNTALVGASAGIMAVLFATIAYSPFMVIRMFLFGNVKLWYIAVALIVIDLFQLTLNNTGGHLAHLGGAFFGYLYVFFLKRGTDIGAWFYPILGLFDKDFRHSKKTPFKKVHRNYQTPEVKKESKIVRKDKVQQQTDEILDKISRSGYDSLSKEEKDFLFKAGK
jgi:membrane associated rhomboid family serine protease